MEITIWKQKNLVYCNMVENFASSLIFYLLFSSVLQNPVEAEKKVLFSDLPCHFWKPAKLLSIFFVFYFSTFPLQTPKKTQNATTKYPDMTLAMSKSPPLCRKRFLHRHFNCGKRYQHFNPFSYGRMKKGSVIFLASWPRSLGLQSLYLSMRSSRQKKREGKKGSLLF